MSVIAFNSVSKSFSGRKILDGLSFSVEKGEILAIVGPSGTGKSVTLKHIVNLIEPDSGSVVVEAEHRIGYLFQSGALLAWMSLYDNVALPLRETTSMKDAEIDSRVRAALEAVGLSNDADKFPAQVSGGMLKRAGLARAIVRDADIVLYDEPTSGLDPVTSAKIHRLIRDLREKRGITSVLVTHDLAGALNLADRILLLNEGRAVICAAPQEFVKSNDPVVKEFLSAAKGDIPNE